MMRRGSRQEDLDLDPVHLQASIDNSTRMATFYERSAVPIRLLSLLDYLDRCLKTIKGQTPRLVFRVMSLVYHQVGRCKVMSNGERPDLVMEVGLGLRFKLFRSDHRSQVWGLDSKTMKRDLIGRGEVDEVGYLDHELLKKIQEYLITTRSEDEDLNQRFEDCLMTMRRCLVMADEVLRMMM